MSPPRASEKQGEVSIPPGMIRDFVPIGLPSSPSRRFNPSRDDQGRPGRDDRTASDVVSIPPGMIRDVVLWPVARGSTVVSIPPGMIRDCGWLALPTVGRFGFNPSRDDQGLEPRTVRRRQGRVSIPPGMIRDRSAKCSRSRRRPGFNPSRDDQGRRTVGRVHAVRTGFNPSRDDQGRQGMTCRPAGPSVSIPPGMIRDQIVWGLAAAPPVSIPPGMIRDSRRCAGGRG